MTLPTNLKFIPNIVPGGFMTDAPYTTQFKDIADAINTIGDTVNNLEIRFNVNYTGLGGVYPGYLVINRKIGGSNATDSFGGNKCLLKTIDGQYVAAWYEFDGTTRNWFIKKARSPYLNWSNMLETSKQPTTVASVGATAQNQNTPMLCQNPNDGTLLYIYGNRIGTQTVNCVPFTYNSDGTWTAGTPVTIHSQASLSVSGLGDCVFTNNQFVYIHRDSGAAPSLPRVRIFTSPTGATWTLRHVYQNLYFGGAAWGLGSSPDQRRLIKMDGNYLLAMWEWMDGSARANIGWAISPDGGTTWPGIFDAATGFNSTWVDTGYNVAPGYATGNVFPVSAGGTNPGVTFQGSGFSGTTYSAWDATFIPGTTKVGLVYRNFGGGVANIGYRYAEFDRTENSNFGGWTAYADHVNISPHAEILYPLLDVTDGIARATWIQRQDLAVAGNTLHQALRYCRSDTTDRTNQLDWQDERVLLPFGSDLNSSTRTVAYREWTFLRQAYPGLESQAIDTINGVAMLPVLFSRLDLAVASGSPSMEICLKFLPVSQIDLPF